jgi:N-acetylneuraminic acid mutarotase
MKISLRSARCESSELRFFKCNGLVFLLGVSSIALAVALNGCGGGGMNSAPAPVVAPNTAPMPVASPSNAASVTWKMQWASSTNTASSKIRPRYLAPAARSASIATITANGVGSTEIQYMNAPKTTLTFSAPNGLDTFQIKTYDEQNGQGNVLSVADVTQTITTATANVVSATLNGVIASLRIAILYPSGTTAFQVGTAGTATVAVTAYDTDGNAILEPTGSSDYNTPIHLSVSKTVSTDTGTLTLGTSLLQSTSSVGSTTTLAYSGGPLTPSAHAGTVTASASGVSSASAPVAVIGGSTPNTWSTGAAMPTARLAPAAAAIGTKIYVVGGYNGTAVLSVNEIYDTVANMWSTGAPMPTARWALAAASVNGILYAIGGELASTCCRETNVVEAYDPVSNTWTTKAAMPTARNSLAAGSDGNLIYAIGGFNFGRLNNVERYDPTTNTWLALAPLHVAKSYPGLGVIGTTIVAASGLAGSGVTPDNEAYNPANNAWTTLAPEPDKHNGPCAGAVGGSLYSAGGAAGPASPPLANLDIFNLSGNAWTSGASMPQATISPASAVLNGRLHCFGGANYGAPGGTYYNVVQIYQP